MGPGISVKPHLGPARVQLLNHPDVGQRLQIPIHRGQADMRQLLFRLDLGGQVQSVRFETLPIGR